MKKRLGPVLLSGLMIGPILGSGIIILPPLVYSTAGNWAFPAWCLIIFFGFFFARTFAELTILCPGDGGVSLATEHAFGKKIKLLTSYYLIGAVLFGPAAVTLTAAKYLTIANLPTPLVAFPIMLLSSFLLLKEARFVGKASLVLTSIAALALFISGSLTFMADFSPIAFTLPNFSLKTFSYGMLLLFWTLVGWEVVGNYSGEVENPQKTISQAVNVSFTIVAIISLVVAGATQLVTTVGDPSGITPLFHPLFGEWSGAIMAFLTLSLCTTTYLLFVGGVARLIASLSSENLLPPVFAKKSITGAPIIAILFLSTIYTLVFLAVALELLDVAGIVAFADGFFLVNAIIGLLAGVKLIKSFISRTINILLILIFLFILLQSSHLVLMVIAILPLWVYRDFFLKKEQTNAKRDQNCP